MLVPKRIASPSSSVCCVVTEEKTLDYGDGPRRQVTLDNKPFYVAPWLVLRVAADKDKATDSAPNSLTTLDTQVINNHPSLFVATECNYRWLPSHGDDKPKTSVRDRYMIWEKEKDNNESEGISKGGGMLALLEYRPTLCEMLLAQVATLTKVYSTAVRRKQVKDIKMSQFHKQAYIAAVSPQINNNRWTES